MFTSMAHLIPGTQHWPTFVQNTSKQFESRMTQVKIEHSPSIFLTDMADSMLPIAVAHGEGRAYFNNSASHMHLEENHCIALRYIDPYGQVTERYPYSPNGSPAGIAGVTTADGRITVMMPHPERVFLNFQNTWQHQAQEGYSPWFRMFENARHWVA